MAAEYVILRKFLTKILCSLISMVNGLSGWEDTWSGTECSVGLAVTGCCRGFLPPLLALSCLLPRMGSNSQSSCQSFCLRVTPLYLDSFFTVTSWRREVTKAQVKRMWRDLTVDKSLLVGSQETHVRSTCELAWKA